jgi:biotin operon repressor
MFIAFLKIIKRLRSVGVEIVERDNILYILVQMQRPIKGS